ncbi:peptidoglycan-binding protein LysM [Luteimonas vadosa]|uniref:Peptidoglycan-binding protein LysM n=1 Tax=Luteimonas vadosa TaxID=1165507 RepID=A0ABP9E0L6_9GAMM
MGLFDFVRNAGKKIFGKDDDKQDVTKPLSTHLREHGIDPSGIQFKFEGDGTVVMTGVVPDQETREKAVLVVGNVEGVARVDDRLWIGAKGSAPGAGTTVEHGSAGSQTGWSSRTYTVKSGDTLSKIAKEMYGDAGKYPQIFEANRPMLKDPDEIYPGQVLRIPN